MAEDKDKIGTSNLGRRVTVGIGIIVLIFGIGLAKWFHDTKPKAKPKHRQKTTPIVDAAAIMPTSVRVRVKAMGTVIAADEVVLQAEVSGKIIWVHPEFVEGGFVEKDTVLARIDDRDYRLNVKRQKASLQNAQASLGLEKGQQKVASREWEFMNKSGHSDNPDSDLALRKPQLSAARAAVELARTNVEQAKLDLERTKLIAPFDAVILQATADVGDRALSATVLAHLISTEKFYIKASVDPAQLKWLRFPDGDLLQGSTVLIYPPSGGERVGTLIKLVPQLSETGRMAEVMIEVSDPLLLDSKDKKTDALLLKEFVQVEIVGIEMKDVISLPRTALREGSQVWLFNSQNKLSIVGPDILWSTADEVFVKNEFEEGALLITSFLAAPVQGMGLALETEKSADQKR